MTYRELLQQLKELDAHQLDLEVLAENVSDADVVTLSFVKEPEEGDVFPEELDSRHPLFYFNED